MLCDFLNRLVNYYASPLLFNFSFISYKLSIFFTSFCSCFPPSFRGGQAAVSRLSFPARNQLFTKPHVIISASPTTILFPFIFTSFSISSNKEINYLQKTHRGTRSKWTVVCTYFSYNRASSTNFSGVSSDADLNTLTDKQQQKLKISFDNNARLFYWLWKGARKHLRMLGEPTSTWIKHRLL